MYNLIKKILPLPLRSLKYRSRIHISCDNKMDFSLGIYNTPYEPILTRRCVLIGFFITYNSRGSSSIPYQKLTLNTWDTIQVFVGSARLKFGYLNLPKGATPFFIKLRPGMILNITDVIRSIKSMVSAAMQNEFQEALRPLILDN